MKKKEKKDNVNKQVQDEKNNEKWEKQKASYQVNRLDKLKQLRNNVINKQVQLDTRIERLKSEKARDMFEQRVTIGERTTF